MLNVSLGTRDRHRLRFGEALGTAAPGLQLQVDRTSDEEWRLQCIARVDQHVRSCLWGWCMSFPRAEHHHNTTGLNLCLISSSGIHWVEGWPSCSRSGPRWIIEVASAPGITTTYCDRTGLSCSELRVLAISRQAAVPQVRLVFARLCLAREFKGRAQLPHSRQCRWRVVLVMAPAHACKFGDGKEAVYPDFKVQAV